jgi:hypothetical protein
MLELHGLQEKGVIGSFAANNALFLVSPSFSSSKGEGWGGIGCLG